MIENKSDRFISSGLVSPRSFSISTIGFEQTEPWINKIKINFKLKIAHLG